MGFHAEEEELLEPQALRERQERRWQEMLRDILPGNRFYRRKFEHAGFDPGADGYERLPLTTRAEIEQDQLRHPPYGTTLSYPPARYTRLHQTSGSTGGSPLRWLDTAESWRWWKHCWSIVFRAAGLTADDRILFPFSFGPFVGFWGAFEAAVDLGNFCLPAGGMTTAARLRYMLDNGATVVCCTPTYALRMAEVAEGEGLDIEGSPVRLLVVAGEPGGSVPAVRSRIEGLWGARVIDHVGMTEIGAYGFECLEAPGGMHVIESEFIAEVIDPETGQRLPDGSAGELVLTNLGRWGSPLIRYRTGDQVVLRRERCACGRSFARIEDGIRGRIDDMLVVRGNNVFPTAIEGIIREFAEVAEFRFVVSRNGPMDDLRIEIEPTSDAGRDGLASRVEAAIRNGLNLRPKVVIVESGSLPRFEMKARRLVRSRTPDPGI